MELLVFKLQKIKNRLKKYDENLIFNIDETFFYYKCLPGKEISDRSLKNKDKSMERLTVGFYCNKNKIIKKKLLVIHKFKSPRCFGTWSLHSIVDWYSQKNLWITGDIFRN